MQLITDLSCMVFCVFAKICTYHASKNLWAPYSYNSIFPCGAPHTVFAIAILLRMPSVWQCYILLRGMTHPLYQDLEVSGGSSGEG